MSFKNFTKTDCIILNMACNNNFYTREIVETIIRSKPEKLHLTLQPNGENYIWDINFITYSKEVCGCEEICGFYITSFFNNCVEQGYCPKTALIDFIFILPRFRRKGLMTKYINKLKSEYDEINIDTDKSNMVKTISKLGFEYQRPCHNGKELYFRWRRTPYNNKPIS